MQEMIDSWANSARKCRVTPLVIILFRFCSIAKIPSGTKFDLAIREVKVNSGSAFPVKGTKFDHAENDVKINPGSSYVCTL